MSKYMDKQTLETSIQETFERHRRINEGLSGMIGRWELYPEGEKIMNSFKRQSKEVTKKDPSDWRGCMLMDLQILFLKLEVWMFEIKFTPLRPKERKEAIDRISVNAHRLIEDFHALMLPINPAQYFTQDELYERYKQLFKLFDHPDEFAEPGSVHFRKDLKPYEEMFWKGRLKSDVLVHDLLLKLTDGELLDRLAEPAIVSKTESESFPRVFIMRKLAQEFVNRYGKKLYNTIAYLCVLLFDDTSIDRDTVRSALSGFEIDAKSDRKRKYPQRLATILFEGYKKPLK
ncbi:MAG: hypothetical protein IIB78_05575 [Proteobacteria bacterium]|nr:hypothetical protein [Pseudomonadota bacterium]